MPLKIAAQAKPQVQRSLKAEFAIISINTDMWPQILPKFVAADPPDMLRQIHHQTQIITSIDISSKGGNFFDVTFNKTITPVVIYIA